MATGQSILGTHLLDVFSSTSNEVAAFGHSNSNCYMRIYDCNNPFGTGYVMGLSNSRFMLMRTSTASNTCVGIGTHIPTTNATLHVQGTLATSNIIAYTQNQPLYFGNGALAGISNISVGNLDVVNTITFGSNQRLTAGSNGVGIVTTSYVGIGTTNPQCNLHVMGTVRLTSNQATPSNQLLDVQGDALVQGKLTVSELIDTSARAAVYNTWQLYNAVNNSKVFYTNDAVASNCVLFSLSLKPGHYLFNVNVPYKNLSSVIPIDNLNWATIGLYEATPSTFNQSMQPVFSIPLLSIGGDTNDYDTCPIMTYVQATTPNYTNYVIAISGKGHQIQVGGGSMPSPVVLYTLPIRGIGSISDKVDVRQALQLNPIRGSFISTEGQSQFVVNNQGIFDVAGSNVDVYINGTKFVWQPPGSNSDFTVSSSYINNYGMHAITLKKPLPAGNSVEISIWPRADGTAYYSAGYLYQNVQYFSEKWLNVAGGGVRTGERLVVDGDLFVGGNVYFGCNTTVFESGARWDGDYSSITSNIIGSCNIIDGAITTAKILDGAVTVEKLSLSNSLVQIGNVVANSVEFVDTATSIRTSNLMTSTLGTRMNVGSYGYQLQDLTNIQQDIHVGPGMSLSTDSPFDMTTTEGSLLFTYTTNGFISFNDSRYNFNWWQNGGFTLELWTKYNSFIGTSYSLGGTFIPSTVGVMNNSGTAAWAFGANDFGNLTFSYWRGSFMGISGTTTMSTDEWYHVAVSCDSTCNVRLFLNGSLEASCNISAILPTSQTGLPLTLGTAYNQSTLLDGYVSSMRLLGGRCVYSNAFVAPSTPLSLSGSGSNIMLLRNKLDELTPLSISNTGNMTVTGNISAGNIGFFRNRIINGDMRIEQRGGGVAATGITTTTWLADRTKFEVLSCGTYSIQQSTDSPPGFTNSMQVTVTTIRATPASTSYAFISHRIEGYNIGDFDLGTSYASPFVLSFWVKTSRTGTYGVGFDNGPTGNRGYVSTFTVNAANVWERKVIAVPAEISGTWNNTNSVGLRVCICLGHGTNYRSTTPNVWTTNANRIATSVCTQLCATLNATFSLTGIQIEKGTIDTPFEFRPYATELALCQRYCAKIANSSTTARYAIGVATSATVAKFCMPLPVTMVSAVSTTSQIVRNGTFALSLGTGTPTFAASTESTPDSVSFDCTITSGLTAGNAVLLTSTTAGSSMIVDVDF